MLRPLFLLLLVWGFLANSSWGCPATIVKLVQRDQLARPLQLSDLITTSPIRQLFLWEQLDNVLSWHKPIDPVQIEYSYVPIESVHFTRGEALSESLARLFTATDGQIRYFKHPMNQDRRVPHYLTPSDGSIEGYYSASRSIFIMQNGELYTIKLPTNYPHIDVMQPTKANMANDSVISMRRSALINRVDSMASSPPHLKVLTEVASIRDNGTGNGFSIRDLRPLQDGNYYMPAFSIPYVGREIAEYHNIDFAEFWEQHYVRVVGWAKVELLLWYGLQMVTPNAQNWLIQMDQNLMPTGKLFLRDVADSSFIRIFAESLGATSELQADRESSFRIFNTLRAQYEDSIWQMNNYTEQRRVGRDIYLQWLTAQEEAYNTALREYIGVNSKEYRFLTLTEKNRRISEHARRIGILSESD